MTPRPRLLSAPSQQRGFCGWCEWQAQPGTQPSVGGGRLAALAFLRALRQLDHSDLSHFPGGTRIQPLSRERAPGAQRWGDCQRRTWGLQKHCAPGGGPEGRPPSRNHPPPRASGAVCEATSRTNAVLAEAGRKDGSGWTPSPAVPQTQGVQVEQLRDDPPGCTRGHHLRTAAADPNQGETAPTPTRQGS